jgi:1,4-dihydroxy-2-naphthoyl-CoA hydrolase
VSIWFKEISLEEINSWGKGTISESLGLKITNIGENYVEGTMPADKRTFQPYKLVHGGANVVLAESLGSIGGMLTLNPDEYYCVGQEVNANHLRGVRSGIITGRAEQVYSGRKSQVWEIKLYDDRNKLTCISRLTLAVVEVSSQTQIKAD